MLWYTLCEVLQVCVRSQLRQRGNALSASDCMKVSLGQCNGGHKRPSKRFAEHLADKNCHAGLLCGAAGLCPDRCPHDEMQPIPAT